MHYDIPSSKKLWNNRVSVRDHVLNRAYKTSQNLIITYRGKTMTLTPAQMLAGRSQWNKQKFHSKFNDKTYTLYDFRFIPDGAQEELHVIEHNTLQPSLFSQAET